jgi:hypothetical protein
MSKYQEFRESLWVGQAKTEEDQLGREDEMRSFPMEVGEIVQRMCAYFHCPVRAVRYVDIPAGLPTGSPETSAPLLPYDPEKGRYCLGVEIALGDGTEEEPYRIWLELECVPLKHGGLEFHCGPDHFQLPDEEASFFEYVAVAINRELREGHAPAPRVIRFASPTPSMGPAEEKREREPVAPQPC